MATDRKNGAGLDKSKLKTMEKLKEAGFDTAAKIRTLEMEEVCDHGLENELRNIIGLKKAIKAKGPVVIDCVIKEDDKVYPMVPGGQPLEAVFDADDLKARQG